MNAEFAETANPLPEIAGYRVLRRLGQGGMAEVYLAIQLSLQREVAIKLLALENAVSDELAQRFEREARTIARLDHPHIVGIHQKPRSSKKGDDAPEVKRSRSALLVTELYQSLELAMAAQGIHRPVAGPPLRFAEDLVRQSHPLGDRVHRMTLTYLEVRFGGSELDDIKKRTFERGVKEVRGYREPAPERDPGKSLTRDASA